MRGPMTFAENLKRTRLKFNISQTACAKHLEISRRTLQYWESGKESHVPHILMQEGALERMQDYHAFDAYEHLFGSKRNTVLTKSTKSADSAPDDLGSDGAGRDRGEPTEAAST